MSFERTTTSINNLSSQEEITLDLLFDMMVCVSQDVMNHNNTSDLSNTPTGDQSVLLKKAYNLMQMLLSAYRKNKDGISEFASSIQERYTRLVDEMSSILSEVLDANEQIKLAEAKEKELRAKQTELQATRGHLLSVGEECEALQRQIDVLSDPALDEKEKEKKALEEDLVERKKKSSELENEKRSIQENIDSENEKIKVIRDSIVRMQDEEASLTTEENNLLTEKNGLEKGIENLKQKLKEYKEWIDNYPNMSEQITNEFNEIKEKVLLIINSINSAISEDYLKENLFSVSDNSDVFDVENYPDCNVAETHFETIQELQEWFEEMNERIDSLIKIYEKMLVTLIDQSDKITIEQYL